MMTDREAIEARLAQATPGPWFNVAKGSVL